MRRRYLIVSPGCCSRRHSLRAAGNYRVSQAAARGAARCASQVTGRGAKVFARGGARCAAQVLDRGAQADARGAA
jgi:hypothetical protein